MSGCGVRGWIMPGTGVIEGKDTIADIALAAGFSDTSHFIKAYKSQFDLTPKQHRLHLA
ncbi:AraC family transcriptional regulator [Phaeobacter inhibens]|nr:AraC family transcriptional regulator [Phaeobacter inhibens]